MRLCIQFHAIGKWLACQSMDSDFRLKTSKATRLIQAFDILLNVMLVILISVIIVHASTLSDYTVV